MRVSKSLFNVILSLITINSKSFAFGENQMGNLENKPIVTDIIGHDSINNKENILKIQDDFPVYEDFKIITHEKTVYITVEPSTVFITLTQTNLLTETTTQTETETKIATKTSISTVSITPFLKTVESKGLVLTEAPIGNKTNTISKEIYLTNTKLKFNSSQSIFNNDDKIINNTITSINNNNKLDKNLFKTKGELDMILGNGDKFTEASKTNGGGIYKFNETTILKIQTLSPISSLLLLSTTTTNNINISKTTTLFPSSTINKIIPISSISSSFDSNTYINPTKTISVVNNDTYHNESGLEQLLRNFSPYTNLPHAEYGMTNSGNRINHYYVFEMLASGILAIAIDSLF